MLWQLIANGIAAAAIYTLVGIGFALAYNVTRFFNFTHGVLFTIGAYSVLALTRYLSVPLILSVPLGIASSAAIGGLLYVLLYRSLRQRRATGLILLLASLGAYVVIQNLISLVFGDQLTTISRVGALATVSIAGAMLNWVQIVSIASALFLFLATLSFLRLTKTGKAIRAVSSNEQLASLCGIDTEKIVLLVFVLASAMAALAGILSGLDVDLTPTMGLLPLMMAIVAVVIGGGRGVSGVALGALLVGLCQNVGVWRIDTKWQNGIAFLLLVLFLLLRPGGLAARRVGSVG